MKANAPERIWIDPATDLPKLSGHIDNESIEYTRTDAFIEKACEWLRKSLDNGLWVANDVGKTEKEAIIEHFKEAIMFMKVEKTCDFCKHLTWEDIKLIWTIGDEIPYMPEEDFFKELLKRFKALKGE